ncbi:hypothetical protein GCM10010218_29090 [Streptomyces mashuensis]|uniref:Aromatic ring-opening dioxygenase LigA n=1 Tax=Streptomyces mashuensis TaxID=33904 RepID=A0A919B3A4_9ACTN|nr:hypothetical protein [Streptomyces mashuensis]GHF46035.1 hypothetical protein GCM10010218_29090 [Streptomyces mashuensis]
MNPKHLRTVAIAACLPYLSLKVAWLAGSTVGIPEGSPLRTAGTALKAVNGLTVLMDACVVVLALALTRPWGRRIPAWLLVLPMWTAVGLLTHIAVGFPAQLVLRLAGVTQPQDRTGGEPFLDEWVFDVVYGGFIVQAVALGALFVLYARARWGHLWRGRIGDPGRGGVPWAAVAAAVLTVVPVTAHAVWASGSGLGLPPETARRYGPDAAVADGAFVLYAVAAAVGVGLWAARRRTGVVAVPVRVPLLLAGVGSAATACWGGWLLLAAATAPGRGDEAVTAAMLATYAVQVLVGLLMLAAGARALSGRQRVGAA